MARPGKPARGTRTGRPIMVVLDLLGRRWMMRVLWELREDTLTFRDLRSRCANMSPSVLNARLKELRESKLVELTDAGYGLTRLGRELLDRLEPLYGWSEKWAREFDRA